ncbi:MAG TPA: lamin tail domain-containing protein [Longimicrobium sp.]|jgi:alpha-tubulin suppressor-like RCC1 family protein
MIRIRTCAVAAAAALLAACADRQPLAVPPAPETPPAPQAELQRLECTASVRERTVACTPAGATGGRGVILGGQGTNVRLTSSNVVFDGATGVLRTDVTVQNLLPQAMGTADGVTPHPTGTRVFFNTGPTVTGGWGAVSVKNPDGTATFTAANQPYFQYPGILQPTAVSAARQWQFQLEPSVVTFAFTVFVETAVPPHLVITEIMARPSTADGGAGEWFEVYNAGKFTVNLAGWTIASGGDAGHTVAGSLTVAPGAYRVLGRSTSTTENGGAPVSYAYSGVTLGNDATDWLALRAPAGFTADSVTWGAAAGQTASTPPSGASLGLKTGAADNLYLSGSGSNWSPSASLYGSGDRGTPGTAHVGALPLVTVSTGHYGSCGTDAAGQIWCWGKNLAGELGIGVKASNDSMHRPVPAAQPAGTHFVDLAGGRDYFCGVAAAGAAYCWGRAPLNGRRDTDYLTPTLVPNPNNPVYASISANTWVVCALSTTFQAWCWGSQADYGFWTSSAPTALAQPGPFEVIEVGRSHFCGLDPLGQTHCMGANGLGALGDSTTTSRTTFVPVKQPAGVTFDSISAGTSNTCGVTPAGDAWCWGVGSSGQLGGGTTPGVQSYPTRVLTPAGVTFASITVGWNYACGLTAAGQAYCWGENGGRLGDGTYANRSLPVAVQQPAGLVFSTITAGDNHTCALEKSTGYAYCWGGVMGSTVPALVQR